MMDFQKFLRENRQKIYDIADNNTPKNKNGVPVICKNDEWRNEDWKELND